MTDVKIRIAVARQRFGKMRDIWADKRLYKQELKAPAVQVQCVQRYDVWVRPEA